MLKLSDINFYKVPFVCNTDTSLGCGSRSKPVLLALEKQPNVKEAWLKNDGTVIGIVWNHPISIKKQQKVVAGIFTKYHIEAIKLNDSESLSYYSDFNISNAWYKGKDVNHLSKKEAKIIAEQLMPVFNNKSLLSEQQKKGLTEDIINVFYDFFLNFKSIDELADTKVYRQKMMVITNLCNKYISKENLPKIEDLLNVCTGHSENCYAPKSNNSLSDIKRLKHSSMLNKTN